MSDWTQFISSLKQRSGVKTYKGASDELIARFELKHGPLPLDLKNLLKVANGLSLEWFRIMPIKDDTDVKSTWDDLERANNLQTSKFLNRDAELFRRFLIFAEIGSNRCAAFERKTETIWYEEDDEMVQTDLGSREFIELSLREVKEL